jgi:hypothetical protein
VTRIRSADLGSALLGALLQDCDSNQATIARLVGLSNYLAIATVALRERAAGRLLVAKAVADRLVGCISNMGVSCHRATFHCIEKPDAVDGTHHRGSFINDEPGALAVIYFGIDSNFAKGAEWAEYTGDHLVAGSLFGYPDCCIASFAQSSEGEADKLPSTIIHTGPYPRGMNPLTFYVYGVPNLLFHFACSPSCQRSAALAETRREFLGSLTRKPRLMQRLGAGIAVYGPKVGIGLITGYRQLDASVYEILEVTTRQVLTRKLFAGSEWQGIRLYGAHRFRIGNNLYSGKRTFAAQFQ